MTTDEVNAIVIETIDAFESLFQTPEENPDPKRIAYIELHPPGREKYVLMFAKGERADQLSSFADAMGLKEIELT